MDTNSSNQTPDASSEASKKRGTRMLADVLWEAANKFLPLEHYSCLAVKKAELTEWVPGPIGRGCEFLAALGCSYDEGGDMFKEFHYGEERQGVRYMWLLLAMHVAEDEGLTV